HAGRGLARRLEPGAREAVSEHPVGVGQARIGGLAHEGVAECELLVAREARPAAADDELALDEVVELLAHARGRPGAAEPGSRPWRPEDVAEDARGPEHAAPSGSELLEADLHHRQHRARQRGRRAAAGDGADDLLEVERVAPRPLEDARDGLAGDARAEREA